MRSKRQDRAHYLRAAADLMAAAKAAGTNDVVMLSSFAVRDHGPQDYSIGAYHQGIEAVIEDSGLGWTFLCSGRE